MQNISLILGILAVLSNCMFCASDAENMLWLFRVNVPLTIAGIIVSAIAIRRADAEQRIDRSMIGLACCLLTLLYYGCIAGLLHIASGV